MTGVEIVEYRNGYATQFAAYRNGKPLGELVSGVPYFIQEDTRAAATRKARRWAAHPINSDC